MTKSGLLLKRIFLGAAFLWLLIASVGTVSKAQAASPTISASRPATALTINAGDSTTFSIDATDADGNLLGAEWYGDPDDPSKAHVSIVKRDHGIAYTATITHTVSFTDPGIYDIAVSAFDDPYTYSETVRWTIHVTPPAHANPLRYRALYVDDFDAILGNSAREQALLIFLKGHGFNEIALYGLHPILTNDAGYTTRVARLHRFISRAKNTFGLTSVKGIGCLNTDFDEIAAYNDAAPADARMDGLVSEYEYWNDTAASIDTFTTLLGHMRAIADRQALSVDAYMGWLGTSETKAVEAQKIAALADIVYLHAYRADPYATYGYIADRLTHFAQAQPGLRIRPIFSAEWRPLSICSQTHQTGVDNMCFMGKWYETNPIRRAENLFMDFRHALADQLPAPVTIDGYQYFAYSYLKAAIGMPRTPHERWLPNLLLD